MAENRNTKRRIARIGMPNGKETKLHSDEGLVQTDCNIVYDIMQQMNKSQNVLSYQQYQESRSKEKSTRTNNSDHKSSSKQNGKINSSKLIKKFFPEKSHSLMAKCRKSMQYLQKNRCMPKPRAHVGSIPRPPQNPIRNFQSRNMDKNHSVSSNTVTHKVNSVKMKQNSEKSACAPKLNEKPKKTKTSPSVDKSCEINAFQTERVEKRPKFISDADTDSDNNYEEFLKHHTEKFVRRRTEKKKTKRKKCKELICAKKIAKVTSKTLPESEDSEESEVECNTSSENSSKITNDDEEFPSKRFHRIVEYQNSDDSTDSCINDFGTLNYDSSSSENENILTKSLDEEKMDFNDSSRFDSLRTERSFDVPLSTSPTVSKNTLCDDVLKLKCKIPCYVAIKRDPILDNKAASLHVDYSVINNLASASNVREDEDDCIIISETSIDNCSNHNSENNTPSIGNRNSNYGESTTSQSACVSKATNINDVQNKYIHNEEHILGANHLGLQTETNSNDKTTEILLPDKIIPLEMHEAEKELSRNVASGKSLCDTEKDKCNTRNSSKNVVSIQCKDASPSAVNPLSQHASNLPCIETNIPLNSDSVTSATEKEMFNVQILSVKSLNESDIIVLSDDNEEKDTEPVAIMNETKNSATEEKDTETVPTMSETKESAAEDSDVEIICLDSSINKEKCVNEKVGDVINNETHCEVSGGVAENLSDSLAKPLVSIEDDCIILDDLASEDTCSVKNGGKVQQTSRVVDYTNNEKATSGSVPDSDKDSILKILGTIDFNCINKVLNETAATDTGKESIPAKTDSTLCDNETSKRAPDSFPEKLKQSQNDACLPQTQASLEASVTPIVPFEVNIKINSLITTPDTREKHLKLLQNSNVGSENVSRSMKWNRMPSSCDTNKSFPVCASSSINLAAPRPFVSEKKIIASSSITESNALLHSRKNQQLLPVNTKVESFENPSDELDIIAAKSIRNMDEKEKDSIVPLLELYRTEYKRFMGMKKTEQHVSAGLKLLQDNQAKKLLAISSSIKNIVKKDGCFHKINNEFASNLNEAKNFLKSDSVEEDNSLDEIKKPLESVTRPSVSCDLERDDKVKIFNQSVVERASEVLNSSGSSSSQEVYNHLINSVCAECGKHAVAACSGCAKIYYCSEKCGMSYWSKGHFATCRR